MGAGEISSVTGEEITLVTGEEIPLLTFEEIPVLTFEEIPLKCEYHWDQHIATDLGPEVEVE